MRTNVLSDFGDRFRFVGLFLVVGGDTFSLNPLSLGVVLVLVSKEVDLVFVIGCRSRFRRRRSGNERLACGARSG
jgi:hypothetical protein